MQDRLDETEPHLVLNICFCLSHFYPIASGAERQALCQANELVRRGHRVQVVTREVAGSPETEDFNGVIVRRLIRPRQLGPLFGLTFVSTLFRSLQRLRDEYDVVHCHQGLWEAVAAGLISKRLGKRTVVQPAAGGDFGEIRQWSQTRGRGLLRRFMLHNSHFVAISQQIESELIEFGVPAKRLTRLASGVDTKTFCPGRSEIGDRLPAGLRVLYLGRLHPQKNLLRLLEAWPAVRRTVAASLLLVGDGPDRDKLVAAAQRLGVADSIHFLGAASQPLDYLRAADLFVLPSVAEGMSNSLLEAMAVELPVVVSSIGGNTDLVTHGETGILVAPNDVNAWSESLVQILQDAPARARIAAAGRNRVHQQFSIEAIEDQYVALYEKLIW